MEYTTKQFIESNRFPQIKVVYGEGYLDKRISGIRIIEIPEMVKYLEGGEILLTSLWVYKECRNETFIKYLEQYSEKKLSGIILKKRTSEKDLELKRDLLRKYCADQRIPLLEMPEELEYWPVIKYVMNQVFDKDIARLKYFKLTHDNFNMLSFSPRKISNQASEVLDLLGSMIENPVALYYTNGNCCASTGDNSDKLVLLNNLEDYTPDILTRFSYSRQQGEFIQYVVRIDIFGEAEVFLVITEKNRELSALDYMALENAIITLMYGFVSEFAQQEIEKKYDHDIVHALLTNTLSRKGMESAVRLLGLNYEQKYQIIVFQTKMDAHGRYDKEFLHEVGVIEGELRALFPGEMIFRNMERIVALHRVSEKETQIALQTKLEELQHTIQRAIQRRKSESRLLIGIGKVVNGVERLSESYQEAKKALTYIDVIRVVSGNSNRMVVRYSNLGFFQLLGDIEDPSKLLQYIPESLRILHDSDSKNELIQTLQVYLDNNQSTKQTSETMFVHYQTVVHRLGKIKKMTGMDFKNANEMLAVRIGIVIYKIIDELE